MNINQLTYDISLLNNVKAKYLSLVNHLNNSIIMLEPMGGRISSIYTVDESSTPISFRCDVLVSRIRNVVNDISNTVLPAIDDAINYKKYLIEIEQANMMNAY